MPEHPALLLVGHGSRAADGVDEYWDLAGRVAAEMPATDVGCGFIELAEPSLDVAIDRLVARGATSVVAVPLVLLGAGHLKNDGPAALYRARHRHPEVSFRYARDLGIHPLLLELACHRVRSAVDGWSDPDDTGVVLVGRGSSDPDANSDLFKVARLVAEDGTASTVEAAFVSLAPPGVSAALERCRLLGVRRIAVVPYFLFTGILVDRIRAETSAWAALYPDVEVRHGAYLGPGAAVARLVHLRYDEARTGDVRMNCDLCVYRQSLPGHQRREAPAGGHSHVHAVAISEEGR